MTKSLNYLVQPLLNKNYYIHNNPIESGFAVDPVDWKYSSARNYQDDHTVLEIDDIGFMR